MALVGLRWWACAGVVDPSGSGGHPLPGTEDAICPNDTGFFLSPDGRWLVFEIGDPGDPSYVAFGEPRYAVYDTGRLERREAANASEVLELAAEQKGPLPFDTCWSADGDRLFFPGQGRSAWFALDAGAEDPTLTVTANPQCAREPAGWPAEGRVEVRRDTPRRIEIGARPAGRALAVHETEDAAATRIDLGHLRLSPDGRFLSYVVTDMQGSFVAPPRAFVLNLDGAPETQPLLLAAPVSGPPRWAPDGSLYACLDDRRPIPRIVRWRLRTSHTIN